MTYTKSRSDWQNDESGGTTITETQLDTIEQGIYDAHAATAKGDLVYAAGANDLRRLAVGAPGLVLAAAAASAVGWSLVVPDPATTLPGSPVKGQLALLTDSVTLPTYQWLFRYNTLSSQTDKWEFIGGPPYHTSGNPNAVINTGTQVGSTGYYYFTGMAFTVPRAGIYLIHGDAWFDPNTSVTAMELDTFSATAVGGASLRRQFTPTSVQQATIATSGVTPAVAASAVIGIAATGVVGTHRVVSASVNVTPVRVS